MNEPTRRRSGGMAGGSLVAVSLVVGLVIGTLQRQPSIGVVVGAAVGLVLYALVWALDRRR